jgi:hypothetical protein
VTLRRKWSRLVPDLGSVPAIAWEPDRAEQILDHLFREALVSEFQVMYARQLYRRIERQLDAGLAQVPVAVVTWTPDASSMLRLFGRNAASWMETGALVVYPGHGFLPTEEEWLRSSFGGRIQFASYESVAERLAGKPRRRRAWRSWLDEFRAPAAPSSGVDFARWPLVALSAGDADDLSGLGYDAPAAGAERDSVHVDTAVLRVLRGLLQTGVRIAYGGKQLRSGSGFLNLLQDVVVASFGTTAASARAAQEQAEPATPLESWRPWPHASTVQERAAMVGLCTFVDVEPPGPEASTSWKAARALSEMRRRVAEQVRATLTFAGKRRDFSGIMPGIAEELLASVEAALPGADQARLEDDLSDELRVVLVGEYGGMARQLVRYVLSEELPLPPELDLAQQLADEDGSVLALHRSGTDADRAWLEERYRKLGWVLAGLRRTVREGRDLPRLGLTYAEWRELMTTSSPNRMRALIGVKMARRLHLVG